MIKINTCHLFPNEPHPLDGTEPGSLLDLEEDPQFPLVPVTDITYSLSALLTGQDLLVTGTAQVQLETRCARCLAVIRPIVRAEKICLLFEKCPDQEVDITEDIREELYLAIPRNFHCKEDCRGLCPGCGANLNTEACRCKVAEDDIPPEENPWNALDSLNRKG